MFSAVVCYMYVPYGVVSVFFVYDVVMWWCDACFIMCVSCMCVKCMRCVCFLFSYDRLCDGLMFQVGLH